MAASSAADNLGLLRVLGLLSIVLIGYRACLVVHRVWFHPLSKFPGPKHLAATNLPYLVRNHLQGTWVHNVAELHHQYGPIVRISPNRLSLDGLVGWPGVFAHRSGGRAEFAKVEGFLFPGIEASIIGAPRDVHRRQRRQLGYAFSEAAMYEQEPIIQQYIYKLMAQLSAYADRGELVDMVKWLNFTTFDIIGDLAFADSFHSLDTSEYHPWVLSIFNSIRGSAMGRFLGAYPVLRPLLALIMGTKGLKMLKQHNLFAAEKARARMELGEEPSGRKDFMTYMMRSNRDGEKGLTQHEIEINSSVLIVAGSETTATAISGLFFYLSQTPTVYKALNEEIRGTFQSEDEINMRSTASMPYLHACIDETLRMYPPAAETPPRVSPGAEISGQYVPAGTLVSVYQYATFRNPQHFVEPDSFTPERWLPRSDARYDPKFERDNRAVFKPFSHGPRDCIGKNLAYAEMRLLVAHILHRFDIEGSEVQSDWHESQPAFLSWQKSPLMLKLKAR